MQGFDLEFDSQPPTPEEDTLIKLNTFDLIFHLIGYIQMLLPHYPERGCSSSSYNLHWGVSS